MLFFSYFSLMAQEGNTGIKAGISISVLFFLWLLLEYYLGLHGKNIDLQPFFRWIFIVIPVVGYYWAFKAVRNAAPSGQTTWWKLFLTGIIITFVIGLACPLFYWLYAGIVNPDYHQIQFLNHRQMIEELNLAIADKQEMLEDGIKRFSMIYAMQTIVAIALTGGLSLSLIISLLVRKSTINKDRLDVEK